jgi:hypothetical protein
MRSLPLGFDPEVAAAVKETIRVWRLEHQRLKLQAQAAKLEVKAARIQRLELRRAIQETVGGGVRRRRQIRRWFDGLQADLAAQMRFIATGAVPPRLKRGRPRLSGLW